jgi:8-oxo-dGTP diphosphatase
VDPFGSTISRMPGEKRRQRIAVYGVCRDDEGRILLARASPAITLQGRWFLPGGGVHHGEVPIDSLTREIEEESGLAVSVGPLLDVLSDVRTIPDGTSLHTVRVIYRVASWSGTLRPEVGGTTDAVGWFTPEEVRGMPLAHYVQLVVDRLL